MNSATTDICRGHFVQFVACVMEFAEKSQ